MAPDATRAFEDRIAEAIDGFNHAPVDTLLLASNRTVAAAAACDWVALIASTADYDADTVGQLSVRAVDIDADIDAVVSTFGTFGDADVVVPETEATGLADAPACREDAELAAGIAAIAKALLNIEIDAMAAIDGVPSSVSRYVRR